MQSLGDAYDGRGDRYARDPRRVAVGAAVSLSGALSLVAALLVVTTPLGPGEVAAAAHLGGILAGLGGPAVLLGVVAVLPTARRQQVGVVAGAAIAVAGVWLFARAYPTRWVGSADPLVFETAAVYFLGGFVALWFLFVAVANVRRRNDPHGTVTLEVEQGGETRRMEVTPGELREYESMLGDGGEVDDVVTEIEDRRGR